MVNKIYMKDNYKKKFRAKVIEVGDNWVRLNKTPFHPDSGGQPSDQGWLRWNGKETKVKRVEKQGGKLVHHLKGEMPKKGEQIKGEIDWERRYQVMRYHTAQHIISRVVLNEYGATTAGNNIYTNYARIDFKPADFDDSDLKKIEEKANEIIKSNRPVEIKTMKRKNLEKRMKDNRCNLDLLPSRVKKLRVIKIGNYDICPCAGTHVKNTKEVGSLRITDNERKGKATERIYYELGK